MRCKYCNNKLADHDIWCVNCGRQTQVPKQELSAIRSMRETWDNLKERKGALAPVGAMTALWGIIPIALLILMFSQISFSLGQSNTLDYFFNIFLRVAAFSLVIPLTTLAFNSISATENYELSFRELLSSFKAYPKFLLLSFISALFYALIYIVCFGLPLFASDPILRLVWIVLVNYWAAIVLPVPALMIKLNIGAFKGIALSYKHFHDLRWNLYLMALLLVVMNTLAFTFLLVGLLVTIPFTWFCVRDYTRKLLDYELLDYRR
ncbi:MAG: hypothetical protein V3576_06260 [Candidatus Cloacimonadota bacterium]